MPEIETKLAKQDRLFFIDNIRWLMIVFVIMVHAAVTYSNIGSWQYTEHLKLDALSFTFFAIFQIISICSFIVRLVQPIGTSVMNMQLGFFSQYIILFIVGIIAYRRNWLARIPYSFGIIWFKIALIGGTISLIAIMILGGGISGDFSRYSGGFYWQSAAYALWESFFCMGVCLGIIVLFRERFNNQGKFTKFMSQNSFSAYVFHAPILILTTLALKNFALYPLLKFMVAVAIAVPLCFLASHFVFRRIPLLKKVL